MLRGIVADARCQLCDEFDSIDHIFLHCSNALKIWNNFLPGLDWNFVIPKVSQLLHCCDGFNSAYNMADHLARGSVSSQISLKRN